MNLTKRFKLDRLAWVFMRVSGFFLVFLIIGLLHDQANATNGMFGRNWRCRLNGI